ncbi:hypothetical protein G7009_18075 [Pseudomonas capeferrum]|uniref:hypothetical protein n=1 Tax=Pseudomonas TaxID=286 RepID=UPI0015E36BC9|nr:MULTISPECIES: hypothetical protein [Pseudomonas]MBA1203632.1 hypothetical protein [Pseudomonas capeferrum]
MATSTQSPLTPAQIKALRLAVDSGGELIIGGPDGQSVRIAVAERLSERGYLRWEPAFLRIGTWYHLTAEGRAVAERLMA